MYMLIRCACYDSDVVNILINYNTKNPLVTYGTQNGCSKFSTEWNNGQCKWPFKAALEHTFSNHGHPFSCK